MRPIFNLCVWMLLWILPYASWAQYKTVGIPFVSNFSPSEYKAGNQNWAIEQDDRGVMYFGNSNGLMSFDGHHWTMIDPVLAISMIKGPNHLIYVGARGDFGYIKPNDKGQMAYFSLKGLLPKTEAEVDHIWSLSLFDGKVYFVSVLGKVYAYDGKEIHVYSFNQHLGCIASHQNKLFIESSKGLNIFSQGNLKVLDGSEQLEDADIRNLFTVSADSLLIVTRTHGLFWYHQNTITPWDCPIIPYLKDFQVYLATQLPNGFIAFGTVESGVLIMDKKGRITQHINRFGGMINDDHCSIFTDAHGQIWSGLEYGISYLHVRSPWSQFNELAGLPTASFYSVNLFDGKLYAGNAQGLYVTPWDNRPHALDSKWPFSRVEGLESRKVWDIYTNGQQLIFSSSNFGTYVEDRKGIEKITEGIAPMKFIPLSDPNFLIGAGEHSDFQLFKRNEQQQWRMTHYYKVSGMVKSVAQDYQNNIWLDIGHEQIARYILKSDSLYHIKTYDYHDGLPQEAGMTVLELDGTLFVGSAEGSYEFDYKTNRFVDCKTLNKILGKEVHLVDIRNDHNGTAWFWGYRNEFELTGYFEKKKRQLVGAQIIQAPFQKVKQYYNHAFFPIDHRNILIGSSNNLLHFDPSISIDTSAFYTLIHSAVLTTPKDSTIFWGNYLDSNGAMLLTQNSKDKIRIPYEQNAIKFTFASAFFEDPEQNLYAYQLQGFDENWSEWNSKTEKEYTNLPEGQYRFDVKSKNLYGIESTIASYQFEILPPWYRTVWAFIAYLLMAIGVVWVSIKISVRRIKKENQKLEQIVALRTQEIVEQNQEIRLKNSELEQKTEEILVQNEALNAQNEEILSQRDQIEQQRDLVTFQKEEIETIYHDISQSIDYAKSLQHSILPELSTLKSQVDQFMVLFKPRDKVSGDFYWWANVEGHTVITAVDCTGHGVPGAFMSMLGISYLREIVLKEYVTHPGVILRKLRKEIVRTLKQKGESGEQKDGMDMALVSIDHTNQSLFFAGANNPLYLIRNGELTVYKADNMPIAIYGRMDMFTTHETKFEKGDCIYLFSDGFADQFGGEHGKKFKTKQFKELLLSIYQEPMSIQKDILDREFTQWKGELEQVDDVLVLGVRL